MTLKRQFDFFGFATSARARAAIFPTPGRILRFARFLTIGLILLTAGSRLEAASSFLLEQGPEDAKAAVGKTLSKFSSWEETPETDGYRYALVNGGDWSARLPYKVFIGPISPDNEKQSKVRVEGDRYDARLIKDILNQELRDKKYPASYGEKSVVLSQTLNLISPGFSYMYNSFGSPRNSTGRGVLFGSSYLFLDFVLYYLGARVFFFDGRNPWKWATIKQNYWWILGTMGTFRLIHGWHGFLQVSGHNDVVELKYKFRF